MVLSWVAAADHDGQARHVRHGAAVARPGPSGRESSRCSTTCPAAGPSSVSAAGWAGSSSTGSGCQMGESRRRFTGVHRGHPRGARDRASSSTTASSTSSRAVEIRPAPLAQLQGPHVRLGGLAGVDGAHGPAGRRADGDRPEAVGDRRSGAGRVPPALPELNGAEAPKPILVIVAGVSKDPAEVAADPRGVPAALGPVDGRALRVRQRRLRRHRGLRVLRRPGQQHRQARPRRSSTGSSPTSRCGARPSRSPRSCSTTSRRTDAGGLVVPALASAACRPTRRGRPSSSSPPRCFPSSSATTSAATSACRTTCRRRPSPPSRASARRRPGASRSFTLLSNGAGVGAPIVWNSAVTLADSEQGERTTNV